jgi:hypothetical protein
MKTVINIEFTKQRFTTFVALFESLGSMIAMSYLSVITTPRMEYRLKNTAYTLKSVGENKRDISGDKHIGNIWAITVPLIKIAVLLINSDFLIKSDGFINDSYTLDNCIKN